MIGHKKAQKGPVALSTVGCAPIGAARLLTANATFVPLCGNQLLGELEGEMRVTENTENRTEATECLFRLRELLPISVPSVPSVTRSGSENFNLCSSVFYVANSSPTSVSLCLCG
jgi:hypothetical protein